MNIAIIGSGGREHALEWKFKQSAKADNVYMLPGNGGTSLNFSIAATDFAAIEKFVKEYNIDLLFVGPEAPLAEGIVDYFSNSKLKVFGPAKAAAQLEASKVFSKKFMQKYKVATAKSWEFIGHSEEVNEVVDSLNGKLVIKYDGLAAGKGVFVCYSKAESDAALKELLKQYGPQASFLIEELLVGSEISIIGFTDGKNIRLLSPSQDHKQLLEGDKGPNTGGMGAYCPLDFVTLEMEKQIWDHVVIPTLRGIENEKMDYCGVIYFGIMMTETGPKTLEYNVRFGDPETEVLLPGMKEDLVDLVLSCFDGSLNSSKVKMEDGYFVDIVLASGGYPKSYNKGYKIEGLDHLPKEALVFHAGTKSLEDEVLTNGGRVLNVVGKGKTLNEAIQKAYEFADTIEFVDKFCRRDIGNREELKGNAPNL